ncbi:hypothetical protein [Streptomyces megasporus]|uniref:hypothetical protein n=1 Tax=Streptomyces megasporus TaxID=44060 RepID=UPI001B8045EC|nr:hypothetical protein [Streptomyces megasporus]
MVELVAVLVGGGTAAWLLRRKGRQRAESAARGETIAVPCLVRHPVRGGRWKRGRMLVGPGSMVWRPAGGHGGPDRLPPRLRKVEVRRPTWKEALWINGGGLVIECASAEGEVWIGVMPREAGHLLHVLDGDPRTSPDTGDRIVAGGT